MILSPPCTVWNNCKRNENGTWTDLGTGTNFGLSKNWTTANSRDSYFISSRKNFIFGNPWDIRYVLSYYGSCFGRQTVCNDEIIYHDLPDLKKFKNSKIFLST